jgi:predicted O-methyltransferase YrrM
MTGALLPEPVRLATERAERAGFSMSCAPAPAGCSPSWPAAVPANGRVLELGTGAGAGTAWITCGLQGRAEVEVVTVEIDAATAALAAQYLWPPWVRLLIGDAMEITRTAGSFDLIFANAQGGKWEALDTTVAALRPGAHLLVDDMTPGEFADDHHARKTSEVRARLLDHPELTSIEITWSTGLILSIRRRN